MVTAMPRWARVMAAARPLGPEPTMLAVRRGMVSPRTEQKSFDARFARWGAEFREGVRLGGPGDADGFLAQAEGWRVAESIEIHGAIGEFYAIDRDGVFGELAGGFSSGRSETCEDKEFGG